jgi:hypothetical protein
VRARAGKKGINTQHSMLNEPSRFHLLNLADGPIV